MQHAYRPVERELGKAQQQHLAFHPAQVHEAVTGGEAAAIEHRTRGRLHRSLVAETDLHTAFREARGERGECRARIEMPLFLEVQTLAEASGEIGLECRDRLARDSLEVRGASTELRELAGVARVCHDQGAIDDRPRELRAPPAKTLRAESCDQWPGILALAPGRKHSARKPRATRRIEPRRALEQLDARAPLGELECAGEPGDAGANDGDAHRLSSARRHPAVAAPARTARCPRRGSARTFRPSPECAPPRAPHARCAWNRTSARTWSRSAPPCVLPSAASRRERRRRYPGRATG